MPNKDIERIKKILAGNPPTPALESLYYGPTPAQDVISERKAGPRELLTEKLQAQLERFGAPTASAKRGAQKITGYGYPMGVADITPAGIPLWAYEGGQSLAKAAEAAGQGEYGTAALEGAFGALGLLPAAKPVAAVTTAAGKEALRRIDRAMMGGEGKLGAALSAIRPQFVTAWHGSPHIFPPVRLIEMPDGTRLYQNMNELAQTPAGAKVLQEFPAGRFDLSKIGTGEGAQAYGHGLYFAEAPGVAKSYKENLQEGMFDAIKRELASSGLVGSTADSLFKFLYYDKYDPLVAAKIVKQLHPRSSENYTAEQLAQIATKAMSATPQEGALYKVDIPDEAVARMLDWDKPLSEQHPDVQRVLAKFDPDMYSPKGSDYDPMEMGQQVYNRLAGILNVREPGPENASAKVSAYLRQAGIPGIKYLDEGSRAAGEGTRNFVAFSDDLPRILEVNGQPTGLQPWKPGEWGGGFQYPRAEALETARKNAVTMLGLPESNTAMDRARAMKGLPVYHATTEDFPAFDLSMAGKGTTITPTEKAVFSSSKPSVANEFVAGPWYQEGDEVVRHYPEGANIMPLMVFPKQNWQEWKMGGAGYRPEFIEQALKEAKTEGAENVFFQQMRDPGFNTLGPGELSTIVATLNPATLRSRFAAFDPARINENDLLGYAQPAILPFTAGAGALGGLGLSQIKERPSDQKKGKPDGK